MTYPSSRSSLIHCQIAVRLLPTARLRRFPGNGASGRRERLQDQSFHVAHPLKSPMFKALGKGRMLDGALRCAIMTLWGQIANGALLCAPAKEAKTHMNPRLKRTIPIFLVAALAFAAALAWMGETPPVLHAQSGAQEQQVPPVPAALGMGDPYLIADIAGARDACCRLHRGGVARPGASSKKPVCQRPVFP